MTAQVHILVEYIDGKPNLTLGAGHTYKTRSFQVKGAAENYAWSIQQGVIRENQHWRQRIDLLASDQDQDYADRMTERWKGYIKCVPDIRILAVSIPDDGELQDGIFPGLLAVPAVSWS